MFFLNHKVQTYKLIHRNASALDITTACDLILIKTLVRLDVSKDIFKFDEFTLLSTIEYIVLSQLDVVDQVFVRFEHAKIIGIAFVVIYKVYRFCSLLTRLYSFETRLET